MNMAGVVQAPKRPTVTPAAASPAATLAAISGEERRGSRPTDTRRALGGTPFRSDSHSAKGRSGGSWEVRSRAACAAGQQGDGLGPSKIQRGMQRSCKQQHGS